jgi:glutathione synthase/RimK-type ligase-like ATP-grasp enzyme
MHNILVINDPDSWQFDIPHIEVITPKEYTMDEKYFKLKNVRVFNLCKSYAYQRLGYYISLLAEARGHKVIPSVSTIQDFKSSGVIKFISGELDELIQSSLRSLKKDEFQLSIYFGKNMAQKYDRLSSKLYNLFQALLLRAFFSFDKKSNKWTLDYIGPIGLRHVPENHMPYVHECAKDYFARKHFSPRKRTKPEYTIGMLVDEAETAPPSDSRALRRFIKAADNFQVCMETITKDDFSKIAEFDALFIRVTTAVNHYTYRFARQASAEGLIVVDDPVSILRCTNKVFLHELLTRSRIPVPKAAIIHRSNRKELSTKINFPCVLKKPDSSFSQGVSKADTKDDYFRLTDELLETSDLILMQEFIPTDFDWRVIVLGDKPLVVCKYFMTKGHWQIYKWQGAAYPKYGKFAVLKTEEINPALIALALKATRLIGHGFYGVDIKEIDGSFYVIEINDNPSIESGVEDLILGDELYNTIIQYFIAHMRNVTSENLT